MKHTRSKHTHRGLIGTGLAALALLACLLGLASGGTVAAAAELGEPTIAHGKSAIVVDSAGNVLYGLNPDEEMPMASITKVMTAMVALDSGKSFDDVCTITPDDFDGTAQQAGYVETDTPTFRELMEVMLVFSGNDAALNVATNVAGSEQAFVDLMNQKAQEIGMEHTHFANPHGLDAEDHYSCASDLVKMGRYALSHYPYIAQTVVKRSTTAHVNGYEVVLNSTDELVGSYAGMRGIKTGAEDSGYAFLGACERDNVQLYTCVLGADTADGRFEDTVSMLDWAYGAYQRLDSSQDSWVVRLQPWAYGLGYKVVVSPSDSTAGMVWPDGSDVSYSTTMAGPTTLLDEGTLCSTTLWSQQDRSLGGTHLSTRSVPVRVSAWPALCLPLFYDTATLGVAQ